MVRPREDVPVLTVPQILRFWARVDRRPGQGPTGQCWGWLDRDGNPFSSYGNFTVGYRHLRANRLALLLTIGEWSALLACHTCDWPPCCRPTHLWSGTDAQNMQDAAQKGRMVSGDRHPSRLRPDLLPHGDEHWARKSPEKVKRGDAHYARQKPEVLARGSRHGCALLTEDGVIAILGRLAAGERHHTIAAGSGVSRSTVSLIYQGKIWAHVPRPPGFPQILERGA